MMNLDDPDHARLRAAVRSAFTPSSVDALAPRIGAIFDACVETVGERFDIVDQLAKPLPTIVIAEYIGVDPARHRDFKHWTDELLLQGYPMPTDAQWDRIVTADAALRGYVQGLIEERTGTPRDDLVTRLIAEPTLTQDEVVAMCVLLIGAGNFTTTDLISNAILAGLKQPESRRPAPAAFVDEALRFDSPVVSLRRFVTEDVEIAGETIRAGSVVNLALAAANHDPVMFDAPDAFDSNRPRTPHLAFGRGVHHCLGAPLARLEACIVVERFFERFPAARLVDHRRTRRMGFRGCAKLEVATGVP